MPRFWKKTSKYTPSYHGLGDDKLGSLSFLIRDNGNPFKLLSYDQLMALLLFKLGCFISIFLYTFRNIRQKK